MFSVYKFWFSASQLEVEEGKEDMFCRKSVSLVGLTLQRTSVSEWDGSHEDWGAGHEVEVLGTCRLRVLTRCCVVRVSPVRVWV